MKKYIIVCILLVYTIIVYAKNDHPIVGTWYIGDIFQITTFTFKPDSTIVVSSESGVFAGTWAIKDNDIL